MEKSMKKYWLKEKIIIFIINDKYNLDLILNNNLINYYFIINNFL